MEIRNCREISSPKICWALKEGGAISELEHNINHLNAELNPICHLLALLGAHHIFHISGLRETEWKYMTWIDVYQDRRLFWPL